MQCLALGTYLRFSGYRDLSNHTGIVKQLSSHLVPHLMDVCCKLVHFTTEVSLCLLLTKTKNILVLHFISDKQQASSKETLQSSQL